MGPSSSLPIPSSWSNKISYPSSSSSPFSSSYFSISSSSSSISSFPSETVLNVDKSSLGNNNAGSDDNGILAISIIFKLGSISPVSIISSSSEYSNLAFFNDSKSTNSISYTKLIK